MKYRLLLAFLLGLPLKSFASTTINCATDYHVFAHYVDGTGKAIEKKTETFQLQWDGKTLQFYELSLEGRQLGAMVHSMYDGKDEFGGGQIFDGVHAAILDPLTNIKVETTVPVSVGRLKLTSQLSNQPAKLENESYRDIFWAISCRSVPPFLRSMSSKL